VFGRLHLVPLVNAFLAEHPDITARMVLSDRAVDLVEDQVDVALRIGALPDSALMAIKVGEVRRVVCGSPAYFAANGVPATPEDLTGHTCVTFSGMGSGTSWTFAARSFRPKCRLNINTAESAIDSAIAGVGVTHVLCYQVAAAVADGRLTKVLRDFEPEPMPVNLIHVERTLVPLKVRRFLDFAAPRLRATLGN
jgi:DNA-binding transcriptional LysR family regulator